MKSGSTALRFEHHAWRWLGVAALTFTLCIVPARPVVALDLNPFSYLDYDYTFQLSTNYPQVSQSFSLTITGQATVKKNLPLEISQAYVIGKVTATPSGGGAAIQISEDYTVSFTTFPRLVGETMSVTETVTLVFPAESATGDYQLTGITTDSRVQIVPGTPGLWVSILAFLPAEQEIGVVHYGATAPPGSGGGTSGGGTSGGGGGGGAPAPAPVIPPGATELKGKITDKGYTSEEIIAKSVDGKATLVLPARTVVLTSDNKPPVALTFEESTVADPVPENQATVSKVYELGPAGTTLEPPARITLPYDPAKVPASRSEKNLTLGIWNEETGKYDTLPEGAIDLEKKTASGLAGHFSKFAVVAPAIPADIQPGNISVKPAEVAPGEDVVITLTLTNAGEASGNYTLELAVNGGVVSTRMVTVEGGATATSTFTVSRLIPGIHEVAIGGSEASFAVKLKPAPTPAPAPAPAPKPEPAPASAPDDDPKTGPDTAPEVTPDKDTTPEPPPTPPPTTLPVLPPPQDWWWLVGVIVGACAAVLVAIVVLVRRRV